MHHSLTLEHCATMEDVQIEDEPVFVTVSFSHLLDMLKCPVCRVSYDEEVHLPKLFGCHHTMCLACLKAMFVEEDQRFPDVVQVVKCPQCPNMIPLLESSLERLPTNDYIQTIVRAVSSARKHQAIQDGSANITGNESGVFPRCSTHAGNNVVIPATTWCEECRETLCAMCVLNGHTDGHGLIFLPDKIRSLRDEAGAFRQEIESIHNSAMKYWEVLRWNVTRLIRFTDVISDSIKKYEVKMTKKLEACVMIPEDVRGTDSLIQKDGPCSIRTLADLIQRMRTEGTTSFRQSIRSNFGNISSKLQEVTTIVTDFQREINQLIN